MDIWIIAAVIVGLLVIAGVAVASLSAADEPEKIECDSCGNTCSEDRNCGLSSCEAVSGGSCGCGG